MPRHCAVSAQRPITASSALWGWVLGAAVQLQQSALWPQWGYACIAMTAAVLGCTLWLQPAWRIRGWGLVLAAAVAFASTGWRAAEFQSTAMPTQWEGRDVRVQGVITMMPQPIERGVRLNFEVERAWDGSHAVTLPPLVSLTWYGELPPQGLRAGQRWEWTVRLKVPHGERNPHSMDWELWLWSQGIQATGYVRVGKADRSPQWLEQTWRAPLAQWRGHLHRAMQAPEAASAREKASWGVIQALVTGAQSSIGPSDWRLFRDTGVAHLVSISGLHITMFAWLAIAVVNVLWRRSARLCLWVPAPVAAAWAGLVLATLYALFSGWGIPAQRTVGMLCVVVLLRTQGRTWPWPYVWLWVLAAVVVADPWSFLQAGFWLSVVAVGVLFATQPRAMHIEKRRWHAPFLQLVREQWVLGLALAPLTLLLFGQISVIGLLANLWAIPWVTLVVTPLAMLGALWEPLWAVAAQCVTLMVRLLDHMTGWSMAVMHFAQPPWWAALAGVVGCLWLVMPWGWRWRVLGVPAVLPLLWWHAATPEWGEFELLALDVGQGSAVLVRTQQHSLLFDAGPRWSEQADAGERAVVPVLHALGVTLDAQMISHADSDHAGGAKSVQQVFPRLQWMGAGGVPCEEGQQWVWDGVAFQVLHPLKRPSTRIKLSSNASSCVLQVRSQNNRRALLTGDIEAAQEQALVQAGMDVRADVLVVPHHGSSSSSSTAFVQAVQPAVAIIQAGYRNRFGHPAPSVLARYSAEEVRWVSSPACGAAWWHSRQAHLVRCEREHQRKYWAHVWRE